MALNIHASLALFNFEAYTLMLKTIKTLKIRHFTTGCHSIVYKLLLAQQSTTILYIVHRYRHSTRTANRESNVRPPSVNKIIACVFLLFDSKKKNKKKNEKKLKTLSTPYSLTALRRT